MHNKYLVSGEKGNSIMLNRPRQLQSKRKLSIDGLPEFAAKQVLGTLAIIMTCGATYFWWSLQSTILGPSILAAILSLGLGIASPALTAFLIPWSPGGMLLARILGKTWGSAAVWASTLYLVYYSFTFLISYFGSDAQPAVLQSGTELQYTLLCIVLFIIIPGLLWSPVMAGELREIIRQEHLVQQYKIQAHGQLQLMRTGMLQANLKMLKGFANMLPEDKAELAKFAVGLVNGIEQTLRDISGDLKEVAGVSAAFHESLADNEQIQDLLYSLADQIVKEPDEAELRRLSEGDHHETEAGTGTETDNAHTGASPSPDMAFARSAAGHGEREGRNTTHSNRRA